MGSIPVRVTKKRLALQVFFIEILLWQAGCFKTASGIAVAENGFSYILPFLYFRQAVARRLTARWSSG